MNRYFLFALLAVLAMSSVIAAAPWQCRNKGGYYYVKQEPAEIKGNKLVFTRIPPRTKFPVKITVVAWQYGRSTEPKVQTAEAVEQSFCLTAR